MTTHSNYSLQNFSTNNAKVLTGNSQPVPDFTVITLLIQMQNHLKLRVPHLVSDDFAFGSRG